MGDVVRLLVQLFDQGGWCEVGVATRLAKVGQDDPMAASGDGHVLGGGVDEVEGNLVHYSAKVVGTRWWWVQDGGWWRW